MVSKFIFRNDYSVITQHSAYANYHNKGMTFKERVQERIRLELIKILMQPKVREKGKEFVVDLIREPQTQVAVVELLKNVMADK